MSTQKKILAAFCCCFFSTAVMAQQKNSWHMQRLNIETRWAKQVSPTNALPEYPRPQMVRSQWANLNGLWDYAITRKDENTPSAYSGKILVPYPVESALSGVKKALQPEQNLWYKRMIKRPMINAGERVLLHFGAVDYEATVYVNGKEVGKHTGGYQNFSFDITDQLKAGNNEFKVKVWDPSDKGPNPHGKQVLRPGGIMYTPSSGIWQTVWMETVPAISIQSLTITPDIDKKQLHLSVAFNSPTVGADGYRIEAIATAKGQPAGKLSWIAGNSVHELSVKGKLHLWSPDDPFLYDLIVSIKKNGKVIDQVKSYFGMRKIEVKKDAIGIERIFLNNQYTYNLGTLDQGFWPDGLYTAPTDAALKFDIEAIKAMGFNTLRKHIKIEPARWYYHCDKLGMLVWQDMVDPANDTKEARDEFEKETNENLAQLHNYPCITTWVLFNEGWGAYDQARLTKWMKEADPSRIVDGHTGENLFNNSPPDDQQKWANSDLTDIHAYPSPEIPPYLPGKARVLGEFGGIGVSIENHLWDDLAAGWGYGGTVSAGVMRKQYAAMIDSLTKLEQRGLSGSIYTQPFDVETEQNGLLTYDRAVIKIPAEKIRNIHAKLWPVTKNYVTATRDFKAMTADTGKVTYAQKLQQYQTGKRDSVFLRNIAIMAIAEKDKEHSRQFSDDYIQQLHDPFTEANLKFITQFTGETKGAGFAVLYNHIKMVNEVLGKDEAEFALVRAISNDEINPYISKGTTPDWDTIERNAVGKYGGLGKEAVWQKKVLYSLNTKNWKIFSETIKPWFENFGQKRKWIRPSLINSIGWAAFKNITDKAVLQAVIQVTGHGITLEQPSGNLLDTHAGLLYKLGRKDEAMEWEKKAIETSPMDQAIKDNYEKMKAGIETWK